MWSMLLLICRRMYVSCVSVFLRNIEGLEGCWISVTPSGGSSVGQNKLLQLILGYIYILNYVQSNFIG